MRISDFKKNRLNIKTTGINSQIKAVDNYTNYNEDFLYS